MSDKRGKINHRTEASSVVSEFNLTEGGKEKVRLDDLIKSLKKTAKQISVKQQLKSAVSKKKLEVPLSKPQAEKIKRGVAYEKVSDEVGKWDKIVYTARSADQIIFPLKKPEFRLESTEEVVKRYQTKTPLEEEVSKLLNSSENVLRQDKELTVAEEKALKAMSLAEAKARHEELKKIRILLSVQEAKARRQKKIKSKRYHRLLKKEKMKKLMKEFEELQKTDPESAQEKLQEADKLRILERMTLKHKSTGKWAKQQQLRAKYNIESRSALKEQIILSKALTEKVIPVEKVVDEPTESMEPDLIQEEDDDLLKLYISSLTEDVDVEKFTEHNRITKLVSNANLESLKDSSTRNSDSMVEKRIFEAPGEEEDSEEDDLVEETTKRKNTLEDFDDMSNVEMNHVTKISVKKRKQDTESENAPEKHSGIYVSETDFSTDVKFLESMIPDEITFGDEALDDTEEDKMNIKQAFANEDFIAEFKEDKKAVVNKDKSEGIDLFLPGWGSWAGSGIKVSKKKRRRFYLKPVDAPVRKDSGLSNVIISEEKDKKASLHQVNNLPFPFKHIDQFHSIIRQPIGNTWIPETSHQKIIAPPIVTELGKVINPIDPEDVVFEKKKKVSIDEHKKTNKRNSGTFKNQRKTRNENHKK